MTLSCPQSADGRAFAYSYQFGAQVKDGVLHGERGTAGDPGWLSLDGPLGQTKYILYFFFFYFYFFFFFFFPIII